MRIWDYLNKKIESDYLFTAMYPYFIPKYKWLWFYKYVLRTIRLYFFVGIKIIKGE